MKKIYALLFLLSSLFINAQEDTLQIKIKEFQRRIQVAEGAHKLQLLDSLAGLTIQRPDPSHDSIAKATISYAIELDSVNLATKHLASLLFLYNNILDRSKEGTELFADFISKKLPITDTMALANLYQQGGHAYSNSGEEKKSLAVYDMAMDFALKEKDSSLYAQIKGYKAFSLTTIGDFATASQEYQKALAVFIKRKDTANMIRVRGGLSVIYGKNEFFVECQKELDEIEKLALASKNIPAYVVTLGNKATNYAEQKKYKESIESTKKALDLIEKYPMFQTLEASRLRTQVSNYLATDSLDLAKAMLEKLKVKFEATNMDFSLEAKYTEALAKVYFAEKKYTEAKKAATSLLTLVTKSNSYENIMDTNALLYKIEEKLGNTSNAIAHYKAYNHIKDSIESVQKTNALAYYQTLYETEKRDAKIELQHSEISLLEAKNKLSQQWIIFGGLGLLALFSIIYLMRSRKFAISKQTLQEQFSQDLLKGQEEERSRLARELHDSVGQKLMLLSKTTKKLGSENAEQLASSTLEEVRSISRGLHPSNLERLGLTMAINALIYDINVNTDLFFTEEIDNIDNILSKELELHLYRIIQETLSNIVKHSEAKAVKMEIQKTANGISVLVSDNGKGFDFESKYKNMSLGLKTLYERAKILGSQLKLKTEPDKGTTLTLDILI